MLIKNAVSLRDEIFFGQALRVAFLDSLIMHRKKIIRDIRRQKLFTS